MPEHLRDFQTSMPGPHDIVRGTRKQARALILCVLPAGLPGCLPGCRLGCLRRRWPRCRSRIRQRNRCSPHSCRRCSQTSKQPGVTCLLSRQRRHRRRQRPRVLQTSRQLGHMAAPQRHQHRCSRRQQPQRSRQVISQSSHLQRHCSQWTSLHRSMQKMLQSPHQSERSRLRLNRRLRQRRQQISLTWQQAQSRT